MPDRETIIETGDGGAAVVAGMLAVVMIVVVAFFYFGIGHGTTKAIDIDVPKITVGVTPDGQ
jgi:hypothetical protein